MKHYMWTKQDPPYAEAFLKLYDIALHAPFSEFQGLQSEAVTFEVSSLKKWSRHYMGMTRDNDNGAFTLYNDDFITKHRERSALKSLKE